MQHSAVVPDEAQSAMNAFLVLGSPEAVSSLVSIYLSHLIPCGDSGVTGYEDLRASQVASTMPSTSSWQQSGVSRAGQRAARFSSTGVAVARTAAKARLRIEVLILVVEEVVIRNSAVLG